MGKAETTATKEAKPGRPTAKRAAEIDAAIRSTALTMFLSQGFEGTAMEAVAQGAGVPKTTLYKRFPDKRALLRGVLSEQVSNWCLTQRPSDAEKALDKRLKDVSVAILHHAIALEVLAFWNLASAAWHGPNEIHERQEAIGYAKIVDDLEQEIRTLGPANGIEAHDARATATMLMATLGGWIQHVAPTENNPRQAAEAFADKAVAILLHGADAW